MKWCASECAPSNFKQLLSQTWPSLFISAESKLDSKNGGCSLLPFKQSLLILPLLWTPFLFGEALSWQDLLGPRGAMAPNSTFWGPKHLLSFPVCSGWHRQGIFHIWCLHTQRVDLRIFVVEAKLNNFILTFAPIKFSWLLFPTPKYQGTSGRRCKGRCEPTPHPWALVLLQNSASASTLLTPPLCRHSWSTFPLSRCPCKRSYAVLLK